MHRKGELVPSIHHACQTTCMSTLQPGADEETRSLFRQYESKDRGVLFHLVRYQLYSFRTDSPQKHILCWQQGVSTQQRPAFLVIGSANLSQAAWGYLSGDNSITMMNAEMGVFIPGDVLASLLKPGASWDSIVPYRRTDLKPFSSTDRPWSYGTWATEHPQEAAEHALGEMASR